MKNKEIFFAFKKDIEGGHLCVPEIGLKFKTGDGSLILFDGQGLMHGVTSIKKTSVEAKRFSVVYYSLKNMWACDPYEDEIENLREGRTNLEIKKSSWNRTDYTSPAKGSLKP